MRVLITVDKDSTTSALIRCLDDVSEENEGIEEEEDLSAGSDDLLD